MKTSTVMTIKELAKRMAMEYMWGTNYTQSEAKAFALITVNEYIKESKFILHLYPCDTQVCGCKEYWYQVKYEIQNL